MGLFIILLELLYLVRDSLLLELLLFPLLLVAGQLFCQLAQGFVQVLEFHPHDLQPFPGGGIGLLLGFQVLGHLLDLSQDGLLALTAVLVLCIEGLEFVAKDFNLHLRLLRLFALLLDLLNVLLGGLLQLDDLTLEVLDALVATGIEALDILLELFRRLLQRLFLLRKILDVLLQLLQLRLHVLHRLLRRCVLTPVNAVFQESQLVLLALDLAVEAGVVLGGRLHLLNLRSRLLVLAAELQDLLLQL
mmetsp:Transcript_63420/g.148498  ORF Transcript_63420/g.148498 Transcript_63420/m.148498 type:complete len:247 (+) Transcript_63420:992-1732(+)